MEKSLIIVNEFGDEIKYFSSIILKNDVDILYFCDQKNDNESVLTEWYSINNCFWKKVCIINNHYDLDEVSNALLELKNNNYSKVYTYDLNFDKDFLKDDILYCVQKYFKNIYSYTVNSYPESVIKLTKSEFWLKKNYLLTFLNKDLNDIRAVETFKKHKNKEINDYYQKKYCDKDFEYLKSPYYIELQSLLVKILRKYNFKYVSMIGFNNNFFSSRVDLSDITFIYKYDKNSDVIVLNQNKELDSKVKYYITFNFQLEKAELLECFVIHSSVEKMYQYNKKSNIDIYREKMVVYVYENVNYKL